MDTEDRDRPDRSPERMHRFDAGSERTARELADLTLERLAGPNGLGRTATPAELAEQAGETLTADGLGAERALEIWKEVLAPNAVAIDHPRYLAFIPSVTSKAAASFDMVIGASNIFGGSWAESSGATWAENETLRWIAGLAGMPEQAGGVFVQGGTLGNLSALVAAREQARHRREQPPERWAVCVTGETHSSVAHSLRTVMDVDVILVPGDERGRMTGDALRATTASLTPAERDGIFAVVATAGTTNLGMVDDLQGIAEASRENGWWMHVDGAYGGAGLLAPSIRERYAGIEHADSLIIDPHKWLFGPFDCCALIYRDPGLGRIAHTQHADYLDAVNARGEWDPSDFAIHLSRRARGLPLWFSLAVHGTDAYRDAVEQALSVTRQGAAEIRAADHLELLIEPELTVLVFSRKGWSEADYVAWSDRLRDEQLAFVMPTRYKGETCARLALVNPVTTVDDLKLVLETMR